MAPPRYYPSRTSLPLTEAEKAYRQKFEQVLRDGLASDRAENERRRALIVRRQAEQLVDLIDQRIESVGLIRQPIGVKGVAHLIGDVRDLFSCIWKGSAEKPQRRDLVGAEHRNLALQMAAVIFEHGYAFVGVHDDGLQGAGSEKRQNDDAREEVN